MPMSEEIRARLVAAGALDPMAADVSLRVQALEKLLDLGASPEELIEHSSDLGYVASRLVNGAQPTMTRRELAERCGLPPTLVDRLFLAAGIPDVGIDTPWANEGDVPMLQTFAAASAIFGEDTTMQLARVVGVSTGRIAGAVASAYRTAVAPRAADADPSGLAAVESNVELAELLPTFMSAVEHLLRRHIVASTRPSTEAAAAGYDSARLCVAFVDLVGSTALAEQLSTAELSVVLTEFESMACDLVVQADGRVVKLIGDEIMFTNENPARGVRTVLAIQAALRAHARLPAARAGVATGDVLTRDGDCFGPTVNLAARLVAVAAPDEALVDEITREDAAIAGVQATTLGPRDVRGFTQPVNVAVIRADGSAV
jgi:class 3 adenylate cyclase